ncbi:MAG: FtsQ-type POTRA domain-containing protein [Calditrichaeota bacterium]|nr:FtsQ-type POTRA domain-containing protein [Calditrichota bacterium]
MKKFKIFQIFLISFFSLVVIFAIFYLLRSNGAFRLRAVQIEGNHYVTREDIARLVDFDFSKDLYQIDVDSIKRGLARHPLVRSVSVSRSYPSVLKIKIYEYQLVAGVAGSDIVAASESKKLIFDYPPEALYDLPIITGIHFKRDASGKRTPENSDLLKYCISVLATIRDRDPIFYSDISDLHYDREAGISLFLKNSNLPVIIGKGKIAAKLNAFSALYHQKLRRRLPKDVLAIDARFQGQVIIKRKT